MDQQRSVFTNYIYNLLLTGLNVLFPVISFLYVSRVIGPSGLGLLNFASSVAAYFAIFAGIGLPIYGVKEIAKARGDKVALNRTFSELFALSLISTGISTVLYVVLLFSTPRFRMDWPVFVVVGSTISINMFSLDWFYSGMEDFRYIALRSGVFKIISLVLLFVFVRSSRDVLPYAAIGVIAASGSNVLNFLNSRKYVKISLAGVDVRRHLKPLMFVLGAVLVTSFYNSFDSVLLGFMKNDRSVGFFGTDRKITTLFSSIVGALGTVLVPRLSHYVDKNLDREYRDAAELSINLVYLLSFPAIVLIEVYSSELLRLLGGPLFQEAHLSLRLIAPQILLASAATFLGSQVLLVHNEEKRIVQANLVGACFSVAFNVVLIPRFDYNATALCISLTEGVIVVVQLLLSRRYLTFRFFSRESLRYAIGSAAMVGICLVVNLFSLSWIVRFFLGSVLSSVAYVVLLYASGDRLVRMIVERLFVRRRRAG